MIKQYKKVYLKLEQYLKHFQKYLQENSLQISIYYSFFNQQLKQ